MSTVTLTAEALPLLIPYRPARMSVAAYHRLIANLELTENNRIELLKGVMVEKMPSNPLHAALVGILESLINALLSTNYHTRSQVAVTLSDSEPEPDVAVVRGRRQEYLTRHPGPADTFLAIEVSFSSLVTDRFKADIYAEASIPWYWIVNLTARRVEVYSQPSPTPAGLRYGPPRNYQPGEMIPVIIDGHEIGTLPAAELLPESGAAAGSP